MRLTEIDRRRFLALGAAALILRPSAKAVAAPGMLWLSANVDAAGRYDVGAFDRNGATAFEVGLPGRGHGIAVSPDGRRALAPARRPGTFAAMLNVSAGTAERLLECPAGRHFHGHAAFSADGRLIFTTENDYTAERGVIGVWDAADGCKRLGEFSSHGIEPHDIRLMPDGRTLAAANGGILTHPDSGRTRLNLDRMDSSLVYLDSRTGDLVEQRRLPAALRLLSIRHLAVNGAGDVAVGLQHQGPADQIVPVFGLHQKGDEIRLLSLPAPWAQTVRNYCGSVAVDSSGTIAAASFPRGCLIGLWDMGSARFLDAASVPDGCGVAAGPRPGGILVTSGRGGAMVWDGGVSSALDGDVLSVRRWDNHCSLVQPA